MEESRKIAQLWRDYFIARLPDYAFAYEEGEIYIRTDNMRQIEGLVKDVYIKCLENGGVHPLPPSDFYKSKKYLEYTK